ncbi:MAG: RNA methyltransferase [Candidatus Zixiibacteriota bacterium]
MALTKTEIKEIIELKQKKRRAERGLFLCEGIRLLEESLLSSYRPEQVVFSPAVISERGKALITDFNKRGFRIDEVSAKDIERISDTKSSQGIAAIYKKPTPTLEQQTLTRHRRILICDNIGDPGNIGTLMRSAAAFGFTLILMTPNAAEMTNPKTIRASMGAFFSVEFIEDIAADRIADIVRETGHSLCVADASGREIGDSTAVPEKVALVVGSEADGVSAEFMKTADTILKIPMSEKVESLNAAMAGTVLMFWIHAKGKAGA